MKKYHGATIYMKGKKVSIKSMIEKYGQQRLEERIESGWETFQEDPYTCIEWMDGMEIRFVEN